MAGFEMMFGGAGIEVLVRQASTATAGMALAGAVLLTLAWGLAGILKPAR
jgi:hypothetical protein